MLQLLSDVRCWIDNLNGISERKRRKRDWLHGLEALETRILLVRNLQLTAATLVDASNVAQSNPVYGQNTFVRANWTSTDFVGTEPAVPVRYTANFPANYFYSGSPAVSYPADSSLVSMGSGNGSWNWYRGGWYAGTSSFTITVTIDPDNVISESNENDNTITLTVNPVAPSNLPSKFIQPIATTPNESWAINNYADIDPRSGTAADYRLGPYQYDGHNAIDAGPWGFDAQDAGIPLVAAADGVVSRIDGGANFDRETSASSRPWNGVLIDHGNGWTTVYGHMAADSITVQVGDTVQAGDVLGLMGSSGSSTGTHIHYTAYYRGAAVEAGFSPNSYWIDPLPYGGDLDPFAYSSGVSNYNPSPDIGERPAEFASVPSGSNGSDTLYFWVETHGLDASDSLVWKYYRPDGTLAFSNTFSVPNTYRNSWWYWSRSMSSFQGSLGTWMVVNEVNGVEISRTSFDVTTSGTASMRVADSSDKILLDGRTTPIDFGDVLANSSAPQRTFTIKNQGYLPLTLSNFELPPGFSFVGSPPTSIAAGSSATLTVRMNTTVVGEKFGSLKFDTNDPNTSDYELPLMGSILGVGVAGAPVITLTSNLAATHYFGSAPTLIAPMATVTDSDTGAFTNGTLTAEFASFGAAYDRLGIRNQGTGLGQIGVNGNLVTYNGSTIGNFSGGVGESPLVINLTAASVTATQALVRNLTYRSAIETTQRKAIRFTLADGTGKTSNLAIQHVVNTGFSSSDLFQPDGIVGRLNGNWWVAESNGSSSFTNDYYGAWGDLNWQDTQTGDFNGDGVTDVASRLNGTWYVGLSNGDVFTQDNWGAWVDLGWRDVRVADVDNDGDDDIVGRTSSGQWWVARSNGSNGFVNELWGGWVESAGWQNVRVADLDGDGNMDIIGQANNGQWWAARSNGSSFTTEYWGYWVNLGWQDVQIADVDGDGDDDVVGRSSSGHWWVARSNGFSRFDNELWGGWVESAGWQNVRVADLDGDGNTDIIGQANNGQWWAARSNGSAFSTQYWGYWVNLGWQDVLVADVDDDGDDDVVGRTSGGDIWVARSNGSNSFVNQLWGNWSTGTWKDVGLLSNTSNASLIPPAYVPQLGENEEDDLSVFFG